MPVFKSNTPTKPHKLTLNDLIYADVPVARQALRKLLAEPMRFSPVTRGGRKTLTFEGSIKVGTLVDPVYIGVASPRGVEPLLPA